MSRRHEASMGNVRFRMSALVWAMLASVLLWSAWHPQSVSGESTPSVAAQEVSQGLPVSFEHWTGDLPGIVRRQQIRALVVYSRSAFFYDHGRPEGISYEALQEFQKQVNLKLRTGRLPVTVAFLPVGYDQLEDALTNGSGDLIAVRVAITPARQQSVAFSVPIMTDVKQIAVTGPSGPALTSLEDLSGKEVFVNPLTVYFQSLQKLNRSLESKGKKPVILKATDKNLGDEDLLEMVEAGLIPATVTINVRAVFWAKVFDHLHLCSERVLSNEEQLAWVMRKDSTQLKQIVDEFVKDNRDGTSFGNTVLRRYLRNTKWVTNPTVDAEMTKFKLYVDYFKKYATEYNLMLLALGHQESGLNQDRTNPSGAIGIMQVIPKYAATSPISVPNVEIAENNIHAGTKMLRVIADTYLQDERLDPLNKTLLTFASYNAGPSRIAALRKTAASEGLKPDIWFGNVELVVAKTVGQETVRYVSNIYKYYVSYKLVQEQLLEQEKAENAATRK
jgi:membrane-bound lytic murein transglycosylase MltF